MSQSIASLLRQQQIARKLKGQPSIRRAKHPPRQPSSKALERQYASKLLELVERQKKLILQRITPEKLKQWEREFGLVKDAMHLDAPGDLIKQEIEGLGFALGRELTEEEIQSIADQQGLSVSEFNRLAINSQVKSVVGIDVFVAEPFLRDLVDNFAIENVGRIKKLLGTNLEGLEDDIIRNFRAGRRAEFVAAEMLERFEGDANRARLVARDQTNKLNGQLTRARQENLGIERYIWRTSLDERVRPSHIAKEGKIFRWDDPPSDTGHPGQDIQCRCTAEPHFDDILEGLDIP